MVDRGGGVGRGGREARNGIRGLEVPVEARSDAGHNVVAERVEEAERPAHAGVADGRGDQRVVVDERQRRVVVHGHVREVAVRLRTT